MRERVPSLDGANSGGPTSGTLTVVGGSITVSYTTANNDASYMCTGLGVSSAGKYVACAQNELSDADSSRATAAVSCGTGRTILCFAFASVGKVTWLSLCLVVRSFLESG